MQVTPPEESGSEASVPSIQLQGTIVWPKQNTPPRPPTQRVWFHAGGGAQSLPVPSIPPLSSSLSRLPAINHLPTIQTPDSHPLILHGFQQPQIITQNERFDSLSPRLSSPTRGHELYPHQIEARSTLDLRERMRSEIRSRSNSLTGTRIGIQNPISPGPPHFGNRSLKTHPSLPSPSIGPKAPRRSRMYRM